MDLNNLLEEYLDYCKYRKKLDAKTIKAYSIDLIQYSKYINNIEMDWLVKPSLHLYITQIHKQYKAKTGKRKIASLKAFFRYLEYEELIDSNPFHKIDTKFREPKTLPKTIPFHIIQSFFKIIYKQKKNYEN